MTFDCNGCDSSRNYSELAVCVITVDNKDYKRFCKTCRSPRSPVYDVYWDGKPEEGLANDPNTGKARVFSSAGEKAMYLKERGLVESGDRVHGAPIETFKNQERKVDAKHEVKMALKKVREMGQDVRRQEYLKITKQGGRHV